jgi:hypothetical protein
MRRSTTFFFHSKITWSARTRAFKASCSASIRKRTRHEVREQRSRLDQQLGLLQLVQAALLAPAREARAELRVGLAQPRQEGVVERLQPPHAVQVRVAEALDAQPDVPGARDLVEVLGEVLEGH